jgi:uncharacterized protein YhfF
MDDYGRFWRDFVELQGGASADREFVVRRIGRTMDMCEQLLELIVTGEKTGTFSLPREFVEGRGIPRVGDYLMLTHFDGSPGCIVVLDAVEVLPFSDIRLVHVACEGPGARDLEVWRTIHRRYWTELLEKSGEEFRDDMPVVYQHFKLVHTRG